MTACRRFVANVLWWLVEQGWTWPWARLAPWIDPDPPEVFTVNLWGDDDGEE